MAGAGVVRWRHEKGKEFSGASGGKGGAGGDVIVRAVHDVQILARYRHEKEFTAQSGEAGKRDSKHGSDGAPMIILLPVGSILTNLDSGEKIALESEGQEAVILKGGNGGLGNEYFKASTNTSPQESTPGKPGEAADFHIELELVADAGAYRTSERRQVVPFERSYQSALKRIGRYIFTTLEPALGSMEDFYSC